VDPPIVAQAPEKFTVPNAGNCVRFPLTVGVCMIHSAVLLAGDCGVAVTVIEKDSTGPLLADVGAPVLLREPSGLSLADSLGSCV
jgi:hypothetical protein